MARLEARVGPLDVDRTLDARELAAARALASEAYYAELDAVSRTRNAAT